MGVILDQYWVGAICPSLLIFELDLVLFLAMTSIKRPIVGVDAENSVKMTSQLNTHAQNGAGVVKPQSA